MLYVFLTIICLTSLVMILKISGIRKADNDRVILMNYVTAFAVSLISSALNGYLPAMKELAHADISAIFTVKDLATTALLAVILGVFSGIAFPMNLFYMSDSIPLNGSALTAFFKQMSTLGGLLVAVAFLGERPGPIKWVGIVLMLVSIILMVSDFGKLEIQKGSLLLLIFASGTIMETDNKLFSKYAMDGYSTLFLTVVFGIAIIYTVIRLKTVRGFVFSGIGLKEVFYGILLGTANLLHNYFKIRAFSILPAAIVIPVVAAGSLILTNIIGIVFFKEKANKAYFAAVVLAIVSLFLLNRQ